jgi:uncharacterized protein (TIGR02217 family)
MSSLIYPNTLPGLTFDSVREPNWATGIQTAVSKKESRLAYMQYPVYRFELTYELLRDYVTPSDLRALWGLFSAMQGRFDTFLYSDPTFNTVTDEKFGWAWDGAGGGGTLCDGSRSVFQLIANYQNPAGPGLPDLIQNLNGTPTIKDNGIVVAPANYTINGQGVVSFAPTPLAGHTLTWSGGFYYRCRFENDNMSLTQFMNKFWKSKTVSFQSIKL